jgi:hypothetical protein
VNLLTAKAGVNSGKLNNLYKSTREGSDKRITGDPDEDKDAGKGTEGALPSL